MTNPNTNPTVNTSLDALSVGRTSASPFITVFENRDPTSADVNYPIQKRWVNLSVPGSATEWLLQSYSNTTGQLTANWVPLGIASLVTATLSGNTNPGIHVPVDVTNNIGVIGDGTTINTTGNIIAHTITISTGSTVATNYQEDIGAATPNAGTLNVLGGTGVTTSGAGNTITISASAIVPLQFTENVGVAIPAVNNLNVLGSGGITTTGAASTITISPDGTIATQYDEDAGSAVPALGILKIVGGVGISTSGAGNIVTITNTSAASIQFDEDSGTATPIAGVVQIVGAAGISTLGNGANKITISNSGAVATTYTTDAGVAVPAANNLNVFGSGAIKTSGAGSTVTISAIGLVAWNVISANQTLAINNGYFCVSPGGVLSLALPAVSVLGDTIEVVLDGSTSWTITQGAGQQIRYAGSTTTLGVGGSLASTTQGDWIRLVCEIANTRWVAKGSSVLVVT